mgnify:CR=1 FL=1
MGEAAAIAFDPADALPAALKAALERDAGVARSEATESAAANVVPYSTRGWGELHALELPPRETFWGETFALCQVQVIFGQGGLGKSRIALNLARNQVLGQPFCGLQTGARPLRHLMMGSENSIHRLQGDVRAMSNGLSPDQITLLGEYVHLATLEFPGDAFISIGDEDNVSRWERTVRGVRPEVLWVDPWGDVLSGEGVDKDVRETLTLLIRIARQVNPDCAIVILAHSRTGAQNIALAVGFGAADFGKGSKALYSAARAVVNLAPYDESDQPPILCVCAKSNDAPRFPSFVMGMHLVDRTYDTCGGVDVEAWREEVTAKMAAKRSATREARKPKVAFDATRKFIVEMVTAKPANTKDILYRLGKELGLADLNARTALHDALSAGVIVKTRTKSWPTEMLHHTPGVVVR